MKYNLRPYQQECVDLINNLDKGSYLIKLFTGAGKTVIFTSIKRKGRTLVLAHREELIFQAKKKYNCEVGIEMAGYTSNGEEVIIASVQSLVRRLDRFPRDYFDTIITDECHHSASATYRKIYDYFDFRLHIGFTATPNRSDNVRLDDIYSDIIYDKELQWGIKNKFLCDINCLRVNIGYDISRVAKRMGDFAPGELDKALNIESINNAIYDAYKRYAKGQTLIFATSVKHCEEIASRIPGAVPITAQTKDREKLIERFTNREIPVLVNVGVFTEGTDMPLIETIMIARPTSNSSLYTQMVGRGLRLHQDKEKLTLIDLVGTTGRANLCTAPTLIGVDMQQLPQNKQDEIEGDLFDLPDLIIQKSDCVESWIRNVEFVDLWAKEQRYNTHNVNWFKMPTGDMVLHLKGKKLRIKAQDELGMTEVGGKKIKMQQALDEVYKYLIEECADQRYIWDLAAAKKWGKSPASEKQKAQVKRFLKNYDTKELTKLEASQILSRMFHRG